MSEMILMYLDKFMTGFWHALVDWKAVAQILILWLVIYRVFLFLQGSKAVYLLRGIIVLIVSFFIFQKLGLFVLSWILTNMFAFFLVVIVVIFQPELREGLMRLGKGHIFPLEIKKEELDKLLREIVAAVEAMARKKTGCLVAIKRDIGLKNYIESGVSMRAQLSSELLQTIFFPLTPLHDGGVVVEGTHIVAAACQFPLSDSKNFSRTLGMRHRAALGLSETSDALVIVVSEENGGVSLAINGQLTQDLTPDDLLTILRGQLSKLR